MRLPMDSANLPPESGRHSTVNEASENSFDIPSAAMYGGAMNTETRVHERRAPREIMEINKDLIAASSTPIVLAILAEGDSYGYAILQRVRELSGGRMEWTDGMLYPVLHRLERLSHVEARWEVAHSGRR